MDMMEKGKKGGGKQKKMTVRVDFTPMVDMLMLLITFFMLCTSLSKPSTMELTMPSNDKQQPDVKKNEAKESHSITIFIGDGDKILYGEGKDRGLDPIVEADLLPDRKVLPLQDDIRELPSLVENPEVIDLRLSIPVMLHIRVQRKA